MTVKDYLYSVRVSDKLIRTKEHELSKLRLNIAQVSVKQNEPVKTSGVNDPMRIVDRIADLQAEINREIDNLVRLKTEIRSKINALDDYRYIYGDTSHTGRAYPDHPIPVRGRFTGCRTGYTISCGRRFIRGRFPCFERLYCR